jgi:hypothetical protein
LVNDILNGKASIGAWKILEIAVLALLAINTGLTGWTLNKVVNLSERITAIEANRFTAKDGLELWKEMAKKAYSDDVPPPEVLRRLDALERQIIEGD